jgi:hypothetical protein
MTGQLRHLQVSTRVQKTGKLSPAVYRKKLKKNVMCTALAFQECRYGKRGALLIPYVQGEYIEDFFGLDHTFSNHHMELLIQYVQSSQSIKLFHQTPFSAEGQ